MLHLAMALTFPRSERRCVADGETETGSSGAQVAAEAMPYHMHRRTDCNTDRRDPGVAPEPTARHPARSRRIGAGIRIGRPASDGRVRQPLRWQQNHANPRWRYRL